MPPSEKTGDTVSYTTQNDEFENARGKKICCYYWQPSSKPLGLFLISHGFTEHSMIYEELAIAMAKRGFLVFAHDHVGHGRSAGPRALIYSINHLVEDTVFHIKKVQKSHPNVPLFLCGHSMGGAVTILTTLEKEVRVNGIVLISPALATNPETATPLRLTLAKAVSKVLPQFPVAYADFRLSCQNKDSVLKMFNDPLRHHGFFKASSVVCLLDAGEKIMRRKESVQAPFLVLHGDSDKVCHVSGSQEFYDGTSSTDKSIKIYKGAYHSLLQEPKEISEDVFKKTIEWIAERT